VIVSSIEQATSSVRLLQLQPVPGEPPIQVGLLFIPSPLLAEALSKPYIPPFSKTHTHTTPQFLPGQFLDVHIPDLPHAGGFSITSAPASLAAPTPYIELAIQYALSNPHAVFLSRPAPSILGTELRVRVGGSFVWPPILPPTGLRRAVFVAGGIGINPLISMLSHISNLPGDFAVKILYSARDPGPGRAVREVLFLARMLAVVERLGDYDALELYLTPGGEGREGTAVLGGEGGELVYRGRRIRGGDVERALGPVGEREGTVVYVCGVPGMTEKLVRRAKKAEGMDERHVLYEKWW
jgi:ferredoxin-NADP reductase